ncbi:hypothetical protein MSPP1_001972 [Malassezia sp. CBS 17886]|nr:hypothetical protein MSPP1_001972 [Malassezia sp. CBS 17886]
MLLPYLVAVLSLASAATAGNYSLCQEWSGHDIFDHFYWWRWNDPTQGKVDYVSKHAAIKHNLSYVDKDTGRFVMRVDSEGDAVWLNGNSSDLGRRSVRIHSNHEFSDGFYIIKVSWMPQGCG